MSDFPQQFFVDRAFKIFDKRGSVDGTITLDEYTETLSELVGRGPDGAMEFLFRIYDEKGLSQKIHRLTGKAYTLVNFDFQEGAALKSTSC